MTTTNQNIVIASGDVCSPVISLTNSSGLPLDVSAALDILFIAVINDCIEITKKKSAGQIFFVTDGTNGQIKISFVSTDFPDLTGVFSYQIYLINPYQLVTEGGLDITTEGGVPIVVESQSYPVEVLNYSSVTVTPSYRGNVT
jgi:hypothetical protein